VLLKEVRQHPEKFEVDQYPAEMCITTKVSAIPKLITKENKLEEVHKIPQDLTSRIQIQ
jgi:hypothetical protein